MIHMDNDTGEIISQVRWRKTVLRRKRRLKMSLLQKIHTIRSPDGSYRRINTVEKLKKANKAPTPGVGSVKILTIEEMMKIQDEEEVEEVMEFEDYVFDTGVSGDWFYPYTGTLAYMSISIQVEI